MSCLGQIFLQTRLFIPHNLVCGKISRTESFISHLIGKWHYLQANINSNGISVGFTLPNEIVYLSYLGQKLYIRFKNLNPQCN